MKKRYSTEVRKLMTKEIEAVLYNYDRLEQRCLAPIDAFVQMVKNTEGGSVKQTKQGPLLFIDREAPILFVAHLDAVGKPHFFRGMVEGTEPWVFSPWLDDRLGVYLGLDVLPQLGMQYDILLCTNEEQGESTGWHFKPPEGRKYNWIFELDRMNDDIVNYQYTMTDFEKALRQAGWGHPQPGSYTDIVELEHLGVCAFNAGVGYERPHTKWCCANLATTAKMLVKLLSFYGTNQDTAFPFDPAKAYAGRRRRKGVVVPVPVHDWNRDNRNLEEAFWFKRHDIVLSKHTGTLWRIERDNPNYYDAKWGCHVWGVVREDPNKAKVYTTLPEKDMLYLTFNKDGLPRLVVLEEWHKDKRPTSVVLYSPILERFTHLKLDMAALTALAPKLREPSEAGAVWEALAQCQATTAKLSDRHRYEQMLFPDGIEAFSESPQGLGQGARPFLLGDLVETPYGRAEIDCFKPCVPSEDEPHYWVKHADPDANGIQVDLLPGSELDLIQASFLAESSYRRKQHQQWIKQDAAPPKIDDTQPIPPVSLETIPGHDPLLVVNPHARPHLI